MVELRLVHGGVDHVMKEIDALIAEGDTTEVRELLKQRFPARWRVLMVAMFDLQEACERGVTADVVRCGQEVVDAWRSAKLLYRAVK